jgi:maleate isomerase
VSALAYDLLPPGPPALGLIVLQADQTIEGDFRAMLPVEVPLHVSRVPSGDAVTPDSLQAMAGHLTQAAALLPRGAQFGAVGYGCTSGTAQIGAGEVAALVRAGVEVPAVTDPLTALVAACGALGVRRLAFLSPYVASVSDRLRGALAGDGIACPVFGSFEEAEEARVVRITPGALIGAARDLVARGEVEAVFLSCTNLQTRAVIAQIEAEVGLPCLSSNQVLAWHMARLAGVSAVVPGRLGEVA